MNPPSTENDEALPPAEGAPGYARSGAGVSLASLFVLTAVAAVLVAGLTPVGQAIVHNRIETHWLVAAPLLGSGGGLLIGIVLGMHQYHRGYGLLLGAGIGGGVGLLAGPLMLVPLTALQPVAMAMFIGSLLMVGVAFLMRPGRG